MYQVRKPARRHKAVFAGMAVAVVALAVGSFLSQLPAAADPNTMRHDVTVREILDAAETRIDEAFCDEPRVKGHLRFTIGEAYLLVREVEKAQRQFRKIESDWKESSAEGEPAPTGMWNAIAGACFQLGRFDEAEEAMLAELAALEPQDRQYAEKLTNIFGNLSRVMMFHRRFDQAESNLRTFDGRLQQITDVDPELRLDCRSRLADLLIRSGKTDDAEVMLSELHAQSVAMLGPEHPRTLTVEFNSAVHCMDRKSDKAIPMFRDLIEKQTRVLGPAHEQTLRAVTNLGLAFMRTGQFVEAESLLEKSMIRAEEKYGADHQLSIMLRDRLRSIQSALDREGGNRQDPVLSSPSAGIESPTPEPSS